MPERYAGDDRALAAYKAGQVDERLDNHDEHLSAINGSIEKSATALEQLVVVMAEFSTKFKIAGWLAGIFLTAWISAIAYVIVHVHH